MIATFCIININGDREAVLRLPISGYLPSKLHQKEKVRSDSNSGFPARDHQTSMIRLPIPKSRS